MTPEKKALIEELAGIAYDKQMVIEAWGISNSNVPQEERKRYAISMAVAKAELFEAEDALKKAMQS